MISCLKCGAVLDAQRDLVAGDWRCPQCGHWTAASAGEGVVAAEAVGQAPYHTPGAPAQFSPLPSKPPVVAPQVNPFADVGNPYAPSYYPAFKPDRNRALSKVQGPGILMQLCGGLLVLTGVGLGIGIPFAIAAPDLSDDDRIGLMVVCCGGAPLCMLFGALTLWGGTRMKSLRSYGLALTSVIIIFVLGFLICIPAALIGIWPLIVLLDSEVKACFD